MIVRALEVTEQSLSSSLTLWAREAWGEVLTSALTSRQPPPDDYNAILVNAIAGRLAEAFAEHQHAQGRKDCSAPYRALQGRASPGGAAGCRWGSSLFA